MLSDKALKKKFRPTFWKDPETYYATEVLKEEGYTRNICKKCNKPFWDMNPDRVFCADPACSEGESFSFIGKSPAGAQLDYVDVWLKFAEMFENFGYTPVARYPLVARWNPTMEYTNASIAAFQPFVISGEVDPPANPLVIPQFCLRFPDIDNVGVTMSHNTGFVMIGQHMFVPPSEWNQNEVFRHIQAWLKDGLKLPNHEVTFIEDAWAGGGNLGCCMEFFSRGCELGNQVYMLFEQTPAGVKDLSLKVLDMGMGMERNAWFSQGCNTMYDAQFPPILDKLFRRTGVEYNDSLMKRYVPYSGLLNLDEVEDIDLAWKTVSQKVEMDVNELKEYIVPLSGVYSIAEHTRSLLVALSDGALPSNVGGGYNLRMLARRALSFISRFGWDIELPEVCEWHAAYLKPIFPELQENLTEVADILEVEKKKYMATKAKAHGILSRLDLGSIRQEKMLELYDSHGIAPDMIADEARQQEVELDLPEDFYSKISDLHEKKEQIHATQRIIVASEVLEKLAETEPLYYGSWKLSDFDATVLHINDNVVVLDKTGFYPTSGGQLHDLGTINGIQVKEVVKQGAWIIHILDSPATFDTGAAVSCTIDLEHRRQLSQHHTAAHIVNAAARKVLGRHINQAGAKKTVEKAHLDVTHYQLITDDELKEIEKLSNDIISQNIPINKSFLPRDEAEKTYGMAIYQGGAVPGKKVRVVDIPNVDVEACGGTHLNNTGETEQIKIIKVNKIQDGVIRITFTAGKAAEATQSKEGDILSKMSELLGVEVAMLPSQSEELFNKWKKVRKAAKKRKAVSADMFTLTSKEKFDGDVLAKLSELLRTQPENVHKTTERFINDLKKWKEQIEIKEEE